MNGNYENAILKEQKKNKKINITAGEGTDSIMGGVQ